MKHKFVSANSFEAGLQRRDEKGEWHRVVDGNLLLQLDFGVARVDGDVDETRTNPQLEHVVVAKLERVELARSVENAAILLRSRRDNER